MIDDYNDYLKDLLLEDIIIESAPNKASFKKVIRGGVLIKKVSCPPGFRLIKNPLNPRASKCVKATASQKIAKLKSIKKARLTRARNAAKNKNKMLLKRAKSLRLRKARNLR